MTAYSEASTLIPCVPAGGKPPPLKWWGNIFRRVWADRSQLVIVIRLPWWGWRYRIQTDDMGPAQLCISWRAREGWRKGWRPA